MAAQLAKQEGARKVGILDCDMHFGDGTVDIIKVLGLNDIVHYSFADCSYRKGEDGEYFQEEFIAAVRDFLVYLHMKEYGIPVATSLAGGYRRDAQGGISVVLELHNNTILECHRVMSDY